MSLSILVNAQLKFILQTFGWGDLFLKFVVNQCLSMVCNFLFILYYYNNELFNYFNMNLLPILCLNVIDYYLRN